MEDRSMDIAARHRAERRYTMLDLRLYGEAPSGSGPFREVD
jgi:hypothetical protein